MATEDKMMNVPVPAIQLNNGLEPATANVSADFKFSDDLVNFHKAPFDGFGPRYGMAPIPFHNVSSPLGSAAPSLVDLELATGSGGDLRQLLFGIVPVKLAAYSAAGPLGASKTYFAWVSTGLSSSTPEVILNQGMTYSGGNGTPRDFLDVALSKYKPWADAIFNSAGEWVPLLSDAPSQSTRRLLGTWPNAFASVASLTVAGRVIPMPWIYGSITAQTTGAIPPIITTQFFGYSSEFAYLNQTPGSRNLNVIELSSKTGVGLVSRTSYNVTASGPYYLYRNTYSKSTADVDSTKLTFSGTTTYGTAGTYATPVTALYNDSAAKHNQRHSVIAAAFGKPYGWLYKEEMVSTISSESLPLIPFDFTRFKYAPVDQQTINQPGGAGDYKENGAVKKTCWGAWPSWTEGTPTTNDASLSCANNNYFVAIGAADSGILRKNTTYEFAFSVYNKLIGHETNVGTPAKVDTGTDDFVCLTLRRSQTDTGSATGANIAGVVGASATAPFPYPSSVNFYEYRVYYREYGTFEWLPAGRIDAANYFFNATERVYAVCQGPIAGLPGGQPGGFVDNSPLPDDEYFQTFVFNNRLFWVSPKSIVFSPIGNPYVYSISNALGSPSGSFLGVIVHAYPGQAEQGARCVIFTTTGTYTARFEGVEFAIQQPVRVSAETVATFPLDGSDFVVNPWTSITAFSYRSAVNAKGMLYWWGPQGLFRDDGVQVPSDTWCEYMIPLLKDLYDKTQTQNICAVYNVNSYECIWFFRDPTGTQRALVYNTRGDSFFLWTFSGILIDAVQNLEVALTGTGQRTPIQGNRIVLMCRDASDTTIPQRAVFFDELVDGGDLRISRVAMCTAVAVQGSNRRLTITRSSAFTLPSSGKVTITAYNSYVDPNTARTVDGIYSIAGSDGSTYIDISPIGGSFPAPSFAIGSNTGTNAFPVWIEAENGFPLSAPSQYFAPNGFEFYGRWTYCQQMFKVSELIRSDGYQVQMQWLTTAGGATPGTRTLTLTDNYRGNYRVHSQIPFGQENAEGQGIATTWTTPSGVHNGGRWYIQYLSYKVLTMTEGHNRRYEG